MNDPEKKIPLVQSLKWTFQWGVAVVLRHQVAVAAYAAGGVVAGLAAFAVEPVGAFLFLAYAFSLIPLAILTHHEVLRGPSALDAATLGQGAGRMLGYLLDTILLGIFAALSALVPVVIIGIVASSGGASRMEGGFEIALFLVAMVAAIVAVSRFALRLPSRALGTPVSWMEAWRLGQSNMLVLTLGPILVSLPLAMIENLADALLPGLFSSLVSILMLPAQVILTCAFLSVAYGQLRDAPAAP